MSNEKWKPTLIKWEGVAKHKKQWEAWVNFITKFRKVENKKTTKSSITNSKPKP